MRTPETNSTISDDFKEQNIKYTLSKREDDLYREENNIAGKVLRIKWVRSPNKNNRWKIIDEHNKVLFVVEGCKFTKKEQVFLQSIEGFNFIIREYKNGTHSTHGFKLAIKEIIKARKRA